MSRTNEMLPLKDSSSSALVPYVAPRNGCRVIWLRGDEAGETVTVDSNAENRKACAVPGQTAETVYYRCTTAVVAFVRQQLAKAEDLAFAVAAKNATAKPIDPDDIGPGPVDYSELRVALAAAVARWQPVSDWADAEYDADVQRAASVRPRLPRVDRTCVSVNLREIN